MDELRHRSTTVAGATLLQHYSSVQKTDWDFRGQIMCQEFVQQCSQTPIIFAPALAPALCPFFMSVSRRTHTRTQKFYLKINVIFFIFFSKLKKYFLLFQMYAAKRKGCTLHTRLEKSSILSDLTVKKVENFFFLKIF